MDTTSADAHGSTANRRLFDARTHWVRALESYSSPEDFRIEINACIQALRNVPFALQADKARIPNFDHWYRGWQLRMRADEKMRWSVEARNTIVKAKDLELHSKLQASIGGSYLDGEVPKLQTNFSPQITTTKILAEFKQRGMPPEFLQHAQLRIERRWVINGFPASVTDHTPSCFLRLREGKRLIRLPCVPWRGRGSERLLVIGRRSSSRWSRLC